MSKRLVVCCDGTWNTPDQSSPTNVSKLFNAIDRTRGAPVEQLATYERGVGTRPWERSIGGMFGFGLSGNVLAGYRFLIDHFTPAADNADGVDDEIFLFGFSRGAFTARSLGGLIRNSGLLRRAHVERVDEAYALYRSRSESTHPSSDAAERFRAAYAHTPRIRFIGVWDTVGALGIPADRLRLLRLFNRRWEFHDTQLSRSVDHAYHAVSIDERRGPFRPTMWIQNDRPGDQVVEQVWFAGVHSDVGGGERDPSLSELALHWMAGRAAACGLVLAPSFLRAKQPPQAASSPARRKGQWIAPDPLGPIHESHTGVWRLLGAHARRPGTEEGRADDGTRAPGSGQSLSSSAGERARREAGYPSAALREYLATGPPITDW
jgi:uncharacterized protein (DUF2235 family)